ncbi:MAG: chromate transporter [Clostridia bacterium]|nr:chromate transporter [Clostridia bacterium]
MRLLADLFLSFARIGLFTFGGGYAMLSMIEHHCVEKKKWITHDEMMNMTVVAESTPGPIAINLSTYVGFKQAGLLGSVIATIGMILPSFLIIYALSMFLNRFLEIEIVARAFWGIKIAVGVVILDAAVAMIRKMKKKALPLSVMIVSAIAMLLINIFSVKISTIALMLASALFGLSLFGVRKIKHAEGGGKK